MPNHLSKYVAAASGTLKRHGVFTLDELRRLGFDHYEVYRTELVEGMHRNIFRWRDHPQTSEQQLLAAC